MYVGSSSKRMRRSSHVLVADDDVDFATLLADALVGEGYRVTVAFSGSELKERVLRSLHEPLHDRFDLILSDIRMPNGTGLVTLDSLKGESGLPPIVLMTAFGSQETHNAAYKLGAVSVIDKPFDISDFCTVVACILGGDAPRAAAVLTRSLPSPEKPPTEG